MTPDTRPLKDFFNDAARKKRAPLVRNFITRIYEARADLRNAPVFAPVAGNSAITLIIGDEVFKTPLQTKTSAATFNRELAIMKTLTENKTPFIPALTYISDDETFFGMQKTKGVTLNSLQGEMSDADYSRFAADFGRARAAIDLSLAQTKLPLWSKFNPASKHENIINLMQKWDKPYVQDVLAQIPQDLRAMLDEYKTIATHGRNLFRHIDLHDGNIMMDPTTKQLTGFIDMSNAVQSPFPEKEFCGLYHVLNNNNGHKLIDTAYRAYSETTATLGVRPFDCFAHDFIGTMAFWMGDIDTKAPEQVNRCINNCVEGVDRALRLLPGYKSKP